MSTEKQTAGKTAKCACCGKMQPVEKFEFPQYETRMCEDCLIAGVVYQCCTLGHCEVCPKKEECDRKHNSVGTAYVVVDGSWSSKNPNIVGWAYVSKGGKKKSGKLTGDICKMHQVGGELKATMEAIQDAVKAGYTTVKIGHDYEGVDKWANGEWETKNKWTAAYARFIYTMRKRGIIIEFNKVTAGKNPADAVARAITGAKDRH